MKFEASKPDLVLELTALDGEEYTLEPKIAINGKVAKDIMQDWIELEKEEDKSSAFDVMVSQLATIYPQNAEWFLANFDLGTLGEITKYVAQELGRTKKKLTD